MSSQNGEADGLASDVSNVADFLGALEGVLGRDIPLAHVVTYLNEAKGSLAQLAVLRVALASQAEPATPPGKGPGMRPVLGR